MVIKGKATGRISTISQEDWEAIVKRGDTHKFEIVNNADAATKEAPGEVLDLSYSALIRRGNKAKDDQQFKAALFLYEKARKINDTATVKRKIEEVQSALVDEEE